jgi:hypothetical protein
MMKYLDRQLNVDTSYTRSALGWSPASRHHLHRRLLFMIENMKSDRDEWEVRNQAALKRVVERPGLKIWEALVSRRGELVARVVDQIQGQGAGARFEHYRTLSLRELEWYVGIVYRFLTAAVRTGDRSLLLHYAEDLARRRFEEGFAAKEVNSVLETIDRVVVDALMSQDDLRDLAQEVHDLVTLAIQLAMDGIEDSYERFTPQSRTTPAPYSGERSDGMQGDDLERIINQLDALYDPPCQAGETQGE